MKVNLKLAIFIYIFVSLSITLIFVYKSKNKEDTIYVFENSEYNIVDIVFDGMTIDELGEKINRSLNSTLSNKGYEIAKKSIELGLDPYLATAIILQETGCAWKCSYLVDENYNIGGMKYQTGYAKFNSLEEGIDAYLNNLYYNYYSKGLITPELMNKKYAESSEWSQKVNSYIEKIKAA